MEVLIIGGQGFIGKHLAYFYRYPTNNPNQPDEQKERRKAGLIYFARF